MTMCRPVPILQLQILSSIHSISHHHFLTFIKIQDDVAQTLITRVTVTKPVQIVVMWFLFMYFYDHAQASGKSFNFIFQN